jgi:hypothetical protein
VSLTEKVKLELADGREIETTYNGIDIRQWEGTFNKSALREVRSLSMVTWLAHHAGVRTGVIDGELKDYKKFDQVCVSVEYVHDDAEEPPDPTPAKPRSKASRKTAGGASSASSP